MKGELNPKLTSESDTAGQEEANIATLLRDMPLPGRIKAAMFGNSTCRALLVRDSQRVVNEAVLNNPQLQEREVQEFLKSTNTPDNVLRKIADSKNWMKSYVSKSLLVTNPKTPVDVAMKWIKYLRVAELKKLSNSKSVPQMVSTTAKRLLIQKRL